MWPTLYNDTNVEFTMQFGNNQPQNVLKNKGLCSVNACEILTPIYTFEDRPV